MTEVPFKYHKEGRCTFFFKLTTCIYMTKENNSAQTTPVISEKIHRLQLKKTLKIRYFLALGSYTVLGFIRATVLQIKHNSNTEWLRAVRIQGITCICCLGM